MSWGSQLASLRSEQIRTGKTPPALRNMPELDLRQTYFFNAYQYLGGSRRASMAGALPIPISEILAYCELFKIDDVDHRELLTDRITFLDGVYLEIAAEKSKPSKPTRGKK